ncbi:MAG: NHL repeat-containing protein [Verrucomicrobiales bacterium]|nr:NHL repeat-containing protein [Verrucomicrobiales bacterium]
MKTRHLLLFLSVSAVFSAPLSNAGEQWVNGASAKSVIGQGDFLNGFANRGFVAVANSLNTLSSVVVDSATGKVFVADTFNNRVLRYASAAALTNGADAEAVLGQPDFTSADSAITQSGMSQPEGLAIDSLGNLWVAERGNHRVTRFANAATAMNGANAAQVLGQADFTTVVPDTTRNRLKFPVAVAISPFGTLWVCDQGNNRILRYHNATAKMNGANADGLLGQNIYTEDAARSHPGGLDFPADIHLDANGRIWVADRDNHRIIRHDAPASKADGDNAEGVIGQIDFVENSSGTTAAKLFHPSSVFLDSTGTLWVADETNNRILHFLNGVIRTLETDADLVIGQSDFTSGGFGLSQTQLHGPRTVFVDQNDTLWVADSSNNRVLRFTQSRFQPDSLGGAKSGRQRGNGIYNSSGSGQSATVKMKGRRSGKAFFTCQNDGDVTDSYRVRATKGNRKLKVKYQQIGRGNVTGSIIRGTLSLTDLAVASSTRFQAKIKPSRKSRNKKAKKTFRFTSTSLTDGEFDTSRVKVKKKP